MSNETKGDEPQTFKRFNVHLIEVVRVKIADVQAASVEEALEKAGRANLSQIIDREFDIPLGFSVSPGAYAQSLSFHEAAPVAAMVEEAGSEDETGQHFDFDDVQAKYVPAAMDGHAGVEKPTLDPEVEKRLLAIVRRSGLAIEDVPDPQRTRRICLAAVQENGMAIEFLNDAQRTPEVCLAAVKEDGRAIQFLNDAQRTPEVCIAAVQKWDGAIRWIGERERTREVCLASVQKSGSTIRYLTADQRTPEVRLAAVSQDGLALGDLTDAQRTPEVCLAALTRCREAVCCLREQQQLYPEVLDWMRQNWEFVQRAIAPKYRIKATRALDELDAQDDSLQSSRSRERG